jgi:dTDP-4-dehydrorhamnose reductase
MRILILGKNGMLGHDLMKTFQDQDCIALGSEDLDITQKEAVFEQFMTVQPDVVLNATGYTNVDLAEQEEEKANMINGYAIGILARAAREIDATLVHFSTDYVFDGNRQKGYSEDSPTNAINAYGRSKELGEKLLIEEMEMQETADQKEGKYFLIRTSWLFGRHGKNFVDTMLKIGKDALEAGKELKVVDDQHGKPTYTLDLAEQVRWLLQSHEYPSGIYHITNETQTTWYHFAREIFHLSNMGVNVVPCTSAEYIRPAKRPSYSSLINSKLPPLRPWKEALKAYLKS